jgi:antitoxin HigA-1
VIKSVSGSATKQFLQQGKTKFSGFDEDLAKQRMAELHAATSLDDLGKLNSVGLHKLKGPLSDFWSVDVNGRWRIIFKFRDGDAYEVEITDTHRSSWCMYAMDTEIFEFPGGVEVSPVPPGRTLAAELAARGLTANGLALKLRVPANRMSDIVRGRRAISPETALRLGRYFGTSAQFWMNLQANYDLAIARQELGAIVEREVEAA